mgnify:CR=1 FL=1
MTTGITVKQFEEFKRTAKDRQSLGHPRVKGFFYQKLGSRGAWRLRYTYNGKRTTQTIADENVKPADAEKLAFEWRVNLAKGENPACSRDAPTFSTNTKDFFELYSKHLKETSDAGKNTADIIKHNFKHLFHKDLTAITENDLYAWEAKRKQKVSRSTLQRALGAFKGMLAFAAGEKNGDPSPKLIAENPIKGFKLSRESQSQREQRTSQAELNLERDLLSPEDKAKLLDALAQFGEKHRKQRASSRAHGKAHLTDLGQVPYPHWFIPFAHIARLTGMRPGDIRRLKWESITTDKRSGQMVLSFTPSKTAHHDDPIRVNFPIKNELRRVLDDWRASSAATGFLFPSPATGKEMDKKAYQRHWKAVKELAKINPEVDFYHYRHTFITDMVNKNAPLLGVARLVGHKTTAMIQKIYFKQDLDDMARFL